jgi:hypothetical protein
MMANLYGAPGPQVCLDPRMDPLGNGAAGGYTAAQTDARGRY